MFKAAMTGEGVDYVLVQPAESVKEGGHQQASGRSSGLGNLLGG